MDKQKRKKLEQKGFRVGTTADFLELTPEEEAYIEIRMELIRIIHQEIYS